MRVVWAKRTTTCMGLYVNQRDKHILIKGAEVSGIFGCAQSDLL